MAISSLDLAWAAGFLEGEGWFGTGGDSVRIIAPQVQQWPLQRLQALFGGQINWRKPSGPNDQPSSAWQLNGAASLMMTLYPLLSPKRQKSIRTALAKWRARRGWFKDRRFANCGHELTPENTFMSGPYRRCRQCAEAYQQQYQKKNRARIAAQRHEYYERNKATWPKRSRPTSPPPAGT